MTITFKCPGCSRLCAFGDHHAGKRARCTSCQQLFIIPSEDGQKAEKVKVKEKPDGAISGFYRAVFVDSWKAFAGQTGVTGMVFVSLAACFKFFVYKNYEFSMQTESGPVITIPIPVGSVLRLGAWGYLFWYYMEIMYWTAFDRDELPEIYLGEAIDLWANRLTWNILKSLYVFMVVLVVVELPFVIIIAILMKTGIEWSWPLRILAMAGLFGFPIAVLTVSVGQDLLMLLRPDYLIMPVIRAFRPYLVTAGLVILAAALLWKTGLYNAGRVENSGVIVGLYLSAIIAVQVITIIAARSVGLFCRHYGCYLAW
jgi:hypothetical protein